MTIKTIFNHFSKKTQNYTPYLQLLRLNLGLFTARTMDLIEFARNISLYIFCSLTILPCARQDKSHF